MTMSDENLFSLCLSLRFYFDPSSGTCRQFYYGGCEGNKNNFKTIRECEARLEIESAFMMIPSYHFPNLLSLGVLKTTASRSSRTSSSNFASWLRTRVPETASRRGTKQIRYRLRDCVCRIKVETALKEYHLPLPYTFKFHTYVLTVGG